MSMSIGQLADQVERKAQLVNMPVPLDRQAYINFVLEGLRTLYGDTSRQDQFDSIDQMINDDDSQIYEYEPNLTLNQQRYVLLTAEQNIFKKMRSSVASIVGYTTNALSITNADKPFANYKEMIDEVQRERKRIFYKLTGGLHVAYSDSD